MRTELEVQIKPNVPYTLKKSIHNDIELTTVEMMLSRPNIEKLRGYKWDMIPNIIIDRLAIMNNNMAVDKQYFLLLNELIVIVSIGYGYRPINMKVVNVSEVEMLLCNNYPTIESLVDLPQLKNGETNYWYLTSSKDDIKFGIDKYEQALREYTRDIAWHLSDIIECDKQHVVYEFTNMYDDLYY